MPDNLKNYPLVSIIIPVFNGSNYLADAIESALNQDYPNIEILVINDGSNDDGLTLKILQKYRDKVKIFHKENGGVATALNLGLKYMEGEFFSWLSHDDLYYENKISEGYRAYNEQNYKNVIIYSDYLVFSPENPKGYLETMSKIEPSLFRYWLITKSQLHGCTLLIPKSAFNDCGEFDESLRTIQDYDMWFRMSKKYNFVYLNKSLVKFRVHSDQDSNKLKSKALEECNVFYEKAALELSGNEVIAGSGKSLKAGYQGLVSNFHNRGWDVASRKLHEQIEFQKKPSGYIVSSIQRIIRRFYKRIIRFIK